MPFSSQASSSSVARRALLFAGLATLVLAGLTLWVRLRLLGYTEFWADQSISTTLSLEWAHGGPLPLASMKTSFGVYNFPLIEYLWAIPLFFKPDVFGVLWQLALVNLIGLGAAAWATARVFGWRVAWWATLLYAVSPWAVYYSRLIWLTTMVPGFAGIFYACLLLYFAEQPRSIYLIVGALSLAAAVQAHPTALLLALVAGVAGLCFPQRLRLKPILISAGLFALTFVPFLIFEIRHGFVDWSYLRAGMGQPVETSLVPVTLLLDLLQSKGAYYTLGSAGEVLRFKDWAWLHADDLMAWLLGLAVVGSALTIGAALRRSQWQVRRLSPRAAGQMLLLVWLGLPLLLFIQHNHYLQAYYFLYLYPVPFVLLVLLPDQVFAWLRALPDRWRAARWVAPAAFLPLALIALQQTRLDLIGQDMLASGVSGHQRVVDTQRVVELTRQLLHDQPDCKLVVIGGTGFSLLREFTQDRYNAYPNRVRLVEEGGDLLPAACVYYFAVSPPAETQAWLAANTHPLPALTIKTPEETWTFHELSAADGVALKSRLFNDSSALGEWENGLKLRRYALRGDQRAGGTLTVSAWWEVTRPVALRQGVVSGLKPGGESQAESRLEYVAGLPLKAVNASPIGLGDNLTAGRQQVGAKMNLAQSHRAGHFPPGANRQGAPGSLISLQSIAPQF